jgi:hypothetical protein
LLAEHARFSDAEAARVGLGGFLHDLGKVGIPDAILRKPDRLSEDEYAVIKTHPAIGMRMLAGHPLAALVQEAVELHHERPDGQGYPRRLRGESVPAVARVVGICDAFDAMTSHRPYRQGIPLQTCPMCGPTLVLRKDQSAGERIYCRNCSGEFELKNVDSCLIATPTGGQGQPEDLEPQADTELIQRTVTAAVQAMPASAMLAAAVTTSRSQ